MAVNYNYHFVEIDNATNMCIGVMNTSNPNMGGPTMIGTTYVEVPVYDEEFAFKYYNWDDGKFYYDPEYTQEYISPLM